MTDRLEVAEYAELHAHTAFSFLDGASQPEEMAAEAARLGLSALAVTDHDGLYGVVRFAGAARAVGLPTVFGAELHLGISERGGIGEDGRIGGSGRQVLDRPTGVPDPRSAHLLVLARGPRGLRAAESRDRAGTPGDGREGFRPLHARGAG